jgi:pimeloyl-ACP methyl ester carboxylesterase
MLHDWGVIPGVIYANRCLKEAEEEEEGGSSSSSPGRGEHAPPVKLVLFDVLPPVQAGSKDLKGSLPESFYELAVHVNYRAVFAFSFLLSHVSSLLASAYFAAASAVMFGLLGKWLNPAGTRDRGRKGPSIKNINVLPKLCYPYYYMFRESASPGALLNEFHLPKQLDKCPVLFLYGAEKNTMFHSAKGLAVLEAAEGSGHVEVSEAGHWLYLQQPDYVFPIVAKYLK